jgi:hypothetical protein
MLRILAGLIAGMLLLIMLVGNDGADIAKYETERTERQRIAETERTSRIAIEESNRTERTYISAQSLMWLATEREATVRLVVIALIVIVASASAVIVTVLVIRRSHHNQSPPPHVLLLAAQTGMVPEHDNLHGWLLVDDTGSAYTVQAARRLLTQRP